MVDRPQRSNRSLVLNQFSRLVGDIWRLSLPYFKSEDRWPGRLLLAGVIAIELAIVAVNVLVNQWNARFFNALQDRSWSNFIVELQIFCALATVYVILVAYQYYLNQWLLVRWRKWMTGVYVEQWLHESTHYRMQLQGDAADNPDQRIADDINQFIEKGLYIVVRLLGSIVTFFSFIAILWGLSSEAPLTVFGVDLGIPGYLVWVAVVYAVVGTLLTHWIGWPLAALNFSQQRFEADFRFNLVRVRENSEQIALLDGERAENSRLADRFAHVVNNFLQLISRQKKVTFFTTAHSQIAIIIPYVVVSPAYFATGLPLGVVTQTASAFTSVADSLSFFVTIYRYAAEWAAVIERLSGFNRSLARAQAMAAGSSVEVKPDPAATTVRIDALTVDRPDGKPLLAPVGTEIREGERVLLTGPSGSGKSTLFRALAGLWPFGKGRVVIPADARIMLLPQRPYFPVTTLAIALSYPADAGTFDDATLTEVLRAVDLADLVPRLHEEAHWNRILSLGEQQRLGIARALLQAPDYLFLDEATASLDEPAEAKLYALLHERLKGTTIVSIGHRSTLADMHGRHVVLEREGEVHKLVEKQRPAAAE